MARCKVKDEDLKELAELYNVQGKKALYGLLNSKYSIKNPYFVFRRMCETPELCYNSERKVFALDEKTGTEKVFLSIEELCSPVIPQHGGNKKQQEIDSKAAALEKLIRELIGDRLLELNRYVTIDSLSKRIIIDKTMLVTDGYQMITH